MVKIVYTVVAATAMASSRRPPDPARRTVLDSRHSRRVLLNSIFEIVAVVRRARKHYPARVFVGQRHIVANKMNVSGYNSWVGPHGFAKLETVITKQYANVNGAAGDK